MVEWRMGNRVDFWCVITSTFSHMLEIFNFKILSIVGVRLLPEQLTRKAKPHGSIIDERCKLKYIIR